MTLRSFELAPGCEIGGDKLPLIAGPCVIEGDTWLRDHAETLAALARRYQVPLIFKSSYDKANRSSKDSYRGPGLERGLEALSAVKKSCGLPVLTDVHEPHHCEPVAEVCDVLQIPAFLCRQTDLIEAAASTGRALVIKKGQFMAPEDMRQVVDKAHARGNERVAVIERGFAFGYRNLVVDMRSFSLLHDEGIPVLYDVTHSLQLPGARKEGAGGDRRFAQPLALAAIAAGADGLFMEVHPDPDRARCDRETQLPLASAETLLAAALEMHARSPARRALEGVSEGTPV